MVVNPPAADTYDELMEKSLHLNSDLQSQLDGRQATASSAPHATQLNLDSFVNGHNVHRPNDHHGLEQFNLDNLIGGDHTQQGLTAKYSDENNVVDREDQFAQVYDYLESMEQSRQYAPQSQAQQGHSAQSSARAVSQQTQDSDSAHNDANNYQQTLKRSRASTLDSQEHSQHDGHHQVDDEFPPSRKIKIEFIADKSKRHITFSKRKAGIMKKAYELSTLTGTEILLLVASETGHVYTYATSKFQPIITREEGKQIIQACLHQQQQQPQQTTVRAPENAASDHQNLSYQQLKSLYQPQQRNVHSQVSQPDSSGSLQQQEALNRIEKQSQVQADPDQQQKQGQSLMEYQVMMQRRALEHQLRHAQAQQRLQLAQQQQQQLNMAANHQRNTHQTRQSQHNE
ncbi:hypothetical protein MP228_009134 [Amoeboaphelidium protococcarum]|nr:hypothetical protein MP228_009134 [Amoeboaphelidium protococcarum]